MQIAHTYTRVCTHVCVSLYTRSLAHPLTHVLSQAYDWTDGRVVFASGSPFPALERNGKTVHPAQSNNA